MFFQRQAHHALSEIEHFLLIKIAFIAHTGLKGLTQNVKKIKSLKTSLLKIRLFKKNKWKWKTVSGQKYVNYLQGIFSTVATFAYHCNVENFPWDIMDKSSSLASSISSCFGRLCDRSLA